MDGTRALAQLFVLGLCLFWSISAAPFGKPKCGYESCNAEKPGMINLHLVPHTHDDVGWIMTVDQYYYREVQWILDGIIRELAADPSKRFIYVEIAFFSRWFEEQKNSTKQLVNKLVSEGRLEFILGGWCMNDEAATHYSAIIDQHKLGFEYLRNNFGDCGRPKIGWQIDPFGHSREQASLFAQFGFDGLFFGRLDYQDKVHRQMTKTMEHVWRGSPQNLGNEANLFTGVLPNGYNPPPGMCFDITCSGNNPKIKDDPKLHDYNVEEMVDVLIASVKDQATWYATDHLIATMGSDFNYVQAHMFFSQIDKLIKYVNARQATGSRINLLYSTPSCYLKELNNDNRTWTTKDDDFFPYADRPHGFWTGYFTSRPTFKYYARAVNSFFQTTKLMATLAKLDNNSTNIRELQRLAAVLGVAQHHDAISGTEKQAVTYDYEERLAEGVRKATKVVNDVYDNVIPKNGTPAPEQNFCPGLNVSSCYVAGLKQFQVTLYNSLSWPVQYMVRLPVAGAEYTVVAEDGVTILPSDVLPLNPSVIKVPKAQNEIFFEAGLPALGYKTFFVTENNQDGSLKFKSEKKTRSSPAQGVVISGKYVSLEFDSNGHVKSLTNKVSGISIPLQQNFFYYEGFVGNNTKGMFQASGAYIFRPVSNTPKSITLSSWGTQLNGGLVQEVHQQFSNWISQVYRVYEDKPYVEVEWTVGPVPVGDHIGKEVITRYNVGNWKTSGTFYTDANGREILKRVLNYRPTWDFFQTEDVAGNYFPVNAFINVKNTENDHQFTVMTDRSQGGTSLHDGDVELMLHRRLLWDDGKGVGEALNEPGPNHNGLIARGTHYLFVEHASQSAKLYRPLAKEIFTTPAITFSDLNCTPAHYVASYHTLWSGLQTALPPNVHVLSMERFHIDGPVPSPAGTVPHLMRFEHFYEMDEDSKLSTPVSFDIKNLFHSFSIIDVHELSLGGNAPIEDVHRLYWKTENNPKPDSTSYQPRRHLNKTTVTLKPMEIVTLQVNLQI